MSAGVAVVRVSCDNETEILVDLKIRKPKMLCLHGFFRQGVRRHWCREFYYPKLRCDMENCKKGHLPSSRHPCPEFWKPREFCRLGGSCRCAASHFVSPHVGWKRTGNCRKQDCSYPHRYQLCEYADSCEDKWCFGMHPPVLSSGELLYREMPLLSVIGGPCYGRTEEECIGKEWDAIASKLGLTGDPLDMAYHYRAFIESGKYALYFVTPPPALLHSHVGRAPRNDFSHANCGWIRFDDCVRNHVPPHLASEGIGYHPFLLRALACVAETPVMMEGVEAVAATAGQQQSDLASALTGSNVHISTASGAESMGRGDGGGEDRGGGVDGADGDGAVSGPAADGDVLDTMFRALALTEEEEK